jgi:lysophospholipase L1-like esterase
LGALSLILFLLFGASTSANAEYALRDGDVVVFLGDSITEARTYQKVVETYTLLRFPERTVRFFNAGIGGDTAEGGLRRLERDVFARGATLVTVSFGINDLGWGQTADAEHHRRHVAAIRAIASACRKRGVRAVILSPPVITADPTKRYDDFLSRLGDDAMEAARAEGAATIDVHRAMRDIQRRIRTAEDGLRDETARTSLHAPDGIHLNDLGQLAMALAILKGLGAPAGVSSVRLDARDARVVQSAGCRVTDVRRTADGVEFTRLDEGLPFNLGVFGALQFRWVPIPQELNGYLLAVAGLAPGTYEVVADSRVAGRFAQRDLEQGVDLSSTTVDEWAPGGPWYAQASLLAQITDARHELLKTNRLATFWLPGSEVQATTDAGVASLDERIEKLQRAIARPRPYRFVVRRLAEARSEADPETRVSRRSRRITSHDGRPMDFRLPTRPPAQASSASRSFASTE